MVGITDRKVLYKNKRYGIYGCPRCHALNITNLFQKTHKCTKCGKANRLDRVNILFGSDDFKEAQTYLQELKKQEALKKGFRDFTRADQL